MTEELAECGFLDDCTRDDHLKLLSCMKIFATDNPTTSILEKVSKLLAKFAEMLDDDAMIYSGLTGLTLDVFAKALKNHNPVESQSVM